MWEITFMDPVLEYGISLGICFEIWNIMFENTAKSSLKISHLKEFVLGYWILASPLHKPQSHGMSRVTVFFYKLA